jgi:thiol-disulfide isomerase/thioredoxin
VAEDEQPAGKGPSRRTLLWLVGAGVVIAGLGVAGLFIGVQDKPATKSSGITQRGNGAVAAPIELPRLNGEGTVSLAAYRGRPVVVNFFASWCVPCRAEMPALQAVSGQLKDKVVFLGVNHNDDRKGGLQLMADTGVQYPTGYDPDGRVAATYGLLGMPSTLFISPDGRLLETHAGQLTRDQLEETINRLFGV